MTKTTSGVFVVELGGRQKYRIVVGQEWDYREDMALASVVAAQLTPWLIAPSLHAADFIAPASPRAQTVEKLAQALRFRSPESETPLDAKRRTERGSPTGRRLISFSRITP